MGRLELEIPQAIRDSLPDDEDVARTDMQRAISGWQHQLDLFMDDREDAGTVVDLIERFEDRWEQYDDLVAELRAWGQSPIYAMAWRDLHAAMIQQLYESDELADRIDRERHARIFEDGIRQRD